MGFLDRRGEGENASGQEREREELASLARVEQGGIPLSAERRLEELRSSSSALFTSDLGVGDFALARLEGLRPLSQVMGSSIYKVGWQQMPWGGGWLSQGLSQELRVLSEAWNEARRRALARLDEEARRAGADAVVGVHMRRGRHDWAADAVEIVALGTAVKLPGADPSDAPVLTDLSVEDFWKLRRAGVAPLGVVAATSVFYITASWRTQRLTSGWQRFQPNQEIGDFTQGVYDARESALRHLTNQAEALRAGGVVGVEIDQSTEIHRVEQNNNEREDLIVTFHVVGTAIAPSGEHVRLAPTTVVSQATRGPR